MGLVATAPGPGREETKALPGPHPTPLAGEFRDLRNGGSISQRGRRTRSQPEGDEKIPENKGPGVGCEKWGGFSSWCPQDKVPKGLSLSCSESEQTTVGGA